MRKGTGIKQQAAATFMPGHQAWRRKTLSVMAEIVKVKEESQMAEGERVGMAYSRRRKSGSNR